MLKDVTMPHLKFSLLAISICLIAGSKITLANTPTNNNLIQTQDARNQALLNQLIPNPTVLTSTTPVTTNNEPMMSDDELCFDINKIAYTVLSTNDTPFAKQLGFALLPEITGKSSLLGKCLGLSDINALSGRVQNRLIERGFVTTRVVIGEQNLSGGELLLTIIPGRVGQVLLNSENSKVPVYVANGKPTIFSTGLVAKTGELLNIRHLETSLENFKRVPSSDANFKIVPSGGLQGVSSGIGFSDVLIDYSQARRVRGSVSIDDSGSKSTGKYQGTATVSVDNISGHNDLFYLNFSRDLGNNLNNSNDYPKDKSKGSKNYGVGYVLPIKNSVLQLGANHYTYHQTVAGVHQDYVYSGESDNINAKFTHLIHRDSRSKSYVSFGGFIKSQNNYIDDTLIDVQQRKLAGYEIAISHESIYNKPTSQHTLRSEISYKRGTGAFNALTPPESLFGEGSARVGIYGLNLNLASQYRPTINNKPRLITHNTQLKAQYANESLVPSERMSIGGRYTVRGFDGERSLSADSGVLLRQDISYYPLWLNNSKQDSQSQSKQSQHNHSVYLGLDAGYTKNKDHSQNELLLGNSLVGAAIGIKGSYTPNKNNPYFSINYDIFTSKALHQPDGFSKKDWVSGVSLGVGF